MDASSVAMKLLFFINKKCLSVFWGSTSSSPGTQPSFRRFRKANRYSKEKTVLTTTFTSNLLER